MGKYRIFILLISMVLMLPLSEALKNTGALTFSASPAGSWYLYICGSALLVFALLFLFSSLSGRIVAIPSLICSLITFFCFWALLGIGLLVVKIASGILGLALHIGAPALIAVVYLLVFHRLKKKQMISISSNTVRRSASSTGAVKFDLKVFYGSMLATGVIALIGWIAGKQTAFLMVPFGCACIGMMLWRVLKLRFFLLLGFLAIELYILVYCIPALYSGETVTFWLILVLSLLYLSILTPLGDLYCHRDIIL